MSFLPYWFCTCLSHQITIVPPGAKGRGEILRVHAKKVKLAPDVDLDTAAANLAGEALRWVTKKQTEMR